MAARAQVPILLLTGFPGSGKTSLLAHWPKSPEFPGAAVTVNELGEVGLDDRLAQTSSDAPILLENGFDGAIESAQSAPGEALERAAYAAPVGGKPPRAGLTIIAPGVSAEEIASFIAARLAISAMQATTHSTGARA